MEPPSGTHPVPRGGRRGWPRSHGGVPLAPQAALTIQDSHIQVHRLLLQQAGLPASQEEHGELARQREELAALPGLQWQLQQERRRGQRTWERQQREQEARACRLREREQGCRGREELLLRARGELDRQLREHRQDLERLREGQRLVESARARTRAQHSLLRGPRPGRQSSLPAALPPGSGEVRPGTSGTAGDSWGCRPARAFVPLPGTPGGPQAGGPTWTRPSPASAS